MAFWFRRNHCSEAPGGEIYMQSGFWKLCFTLQKLTMREEGQDLVEYALVLGLICVGAVSVMGNLGRELAGYYSYIVVHLP